MTERPYTPPTTRPAAARSTLGDALNEAQRRAVETDARRVLILAGAGAGKTRTLTYRAARLVEAGAPPEGVVLVTFTNRAAREMVARIDRLLGAGARRLRAGTFHGLAHLALRRHGEALGLRPGFSIMDREDQGRVMAAAIADVNEDPRARRFPSPELLVSLHALARQAARPFAELLLRKAPQFARLDAELDRALEGYAAHKRAMNLVDFDDLLVGWRALLAREDALGAQLRDEVHHVLVDEYQDTNPLQADLAERLASGHGSLTVVGDDAQSIYAFRGASFENILDFPRRAPTEVHTLTTSYRSTPEILRLANESIRHNPLQFPKTLAAVRGPGPRPVLVPTSDAAEEAAFVAQRVLELTHEGLPLRDQAVLYRAHSHSVELQVELARHDIPFAVRSGVRFFEQAHIKDAIAFLRVVANPADELAWRRVLQLLPGVGARTAGKLWARLQAAAVAGGSPLDALAHPELPARAARQVGRLRALLEQVGQPDHRSDPGAILRALLSEPGAPPRTGLLAEHLDAAHPNARERMEELEQLADIASAHAAVEDFLADVALVSELPGEDASAQGAEGGDWLTLSTVHQAKGLEWRAVYAIGLSDGAFPIQSAIEEPGGEAEERRLFHVAVTRAMDQLYLSYPASRPLRGYSERVLVRPSRFLAELGTLPALWEKWALDPA